MLLRPDTSVGAPEPHWSTVPSGLNPRRVLVAMAMRLLTPAPLDPGQLTSVPSLFNAWQSELSLPAAETAMRLVSPLVRLVSPWEFEPQAATCEKVSAATLLVALP